MDKVIDYTFFIRGLSVAQLSQIEVRENLDLYINLYGLEFLEILLGESLAKEFLIGLALPAPEQKFLDLKEVLVNDSLKVSPVANYVYVKLLEDEITQNSGIGVVRSEGENSYNENPTVKIVTAWNIMAEKVCPMHDKIKALNFPNYAHKNKRGICETYYSCCGANRPLFPIRNRLM